MDLMNFKLNSKGKSIKSYPGAEMFLDNRVLSKKCDFLIPAGRGDIWAQSLVQLVLDPGFVVSSRVESALVGFNFASFLSESCLGQVIHLLKLLVCLPLIPVLLRTKSQHC